MTIVNEFFQEIEIKEQKQHSKHKKTFVFSEKRFKTVIIFRKHFRPAAENNLEQGEDRAHEIDKNDHAPRYQTRKTKA